MCSPHLVPKQPSRFAAFNPSHPTQTNKLKMRTFKVTRNKSVIASLDLKHLGCGDVEIAYVQVAPEHRGQKHATTLLKRAITYAKACEWTLVAVIAPERNSGLTFEQEHDWFRRHGFKPMARYDFGGYRKPVMILNP